MQLRHLLDRSDVPDVRIRGLTCDSRQVRPGDLFIAYRGGSFDGHDYVNEATQKGAVAILGERPAPTNFPIPWVHLDRIAQERGAIAARYFGYPAKDVQMIGVTGTNGKTSVSYGSANLLPSTACVGTIGWGIPPALCTSALTTQDPISMQQTLAALRQRNIERAVAEVSSHALDQRRVDDVNFDCAVFTNLSRDHLDYHPSMDDYARAKFLLFERDELHCGIVNIDDPFGVKIAQHLKSRDLRCLTYGTQQSSDLGWGSVHYGSEGIRGTWNGSFGDAEFSIPFVGEAYLYNAAAMLLVAMYCGMDFSDAVERMHDMRQIPGRMEYLSPPGIASVVLDYAHTPDALRTALGAVRMHTSGRVFCVFGCGGNRDQGKRPEMGRIAQEGADYVVVTSDNPRRENPQAIIDDICTGFVGDWDFHMTVDRTEAIRYALNNAMPDDTVLVAGKGHERYQDIEGVRHPYSDRAAIQCILGERV